MNLLEAMVQTLELLLQYLVVWMVHLDQVTCQVVLNSKPQSDGNTSPTERLRIDSRGSFQFSNGFMNETVKINTTARNGTQAVNLDEGMVHYFSTNSAWHLET